MTFEYIVNTLSFAGLYISQHHFTFGTLYVLWSNTFLKFSEKSVISARTVMSITGLLGSTEKTVKLSRIHMTPFRWPLNVHWKFPMPLDSPFPWTQEKLNNTEWSSNPPNLLQRKFLHPRDRQHPNLYRRFKCKLGHSH